MKKTAGAPSEGYKIPSIINGRVTNGDIKKPTETLVKSSHASSIKNIKIEHRVKIICDSHLKGYAIRINQCLNTKFEVSSFIKLGALTNHLVYSQELELKSLGRKDVIVINGDSNDIDNSSVKIIGVL